jgi:hypothetical protein
MIYALINFVTIAFDNCTDVKYRPHPQTLVSINLFQPSTPPFLYRLFILGPKLTNSLVLLMTEEMLEHGSDVLSIVRIYIKCNCNDDISGIVSDRSSKGGLKQAYVPIHKHPSR